MKIVFDNLKSDINIGDSIEIKINEQTKLYSIDKIEDNTIKSVSGIDGYTTIYIKPI
jgi:hypothetical protein